MRLSYTKRDIITIYQKLVNQALNKYNKCKYDSSIKCIRYAAQLQYQFNDMLVDNNLNKLIKQISVKHFEVKDNYPIKKCNYVFCDFSGEDNHGLTQQYLDAISCVEGVSLLYIHETYLSSGSGIVKKIIDENNYRLVELGIGSDLDKAFKIYNIVKEYRPEKVFFHLHPSTSIPFLLAFYAFPGVEKYNINITDHAFWLGGPDFFDYIFEFRELGSKLSLTKRGFCVNQILLLPFYPWYTETDFGGFPKECEGKTLFFAGGAIYKIEGENDIFLEIVKAIVELSDDIVFLFAGWGDDSHIQQFIENNNLKNKLIFIGHRTDINEVIKHIDVFVGTYPIGGGLMTQYAALNSKPILTYKGYGVEEMLNPKREYSFVYEDVESLVSEAKKLAFDKDYRESKGKYYKSLVTSKEEFRKRFQKLILDHEFLPIASGNNIPTSNNNIETHLERINDSRKLTIELPILKASKRFCHWKVPINIALNIRSVITQIKSLY